MKKISYLNSVLDDRPSFFRNYIFFKTMILVAMLIFPIIVPCEIKTSNPFKAYWAKSLRIRENSRIIIILVTSPRAWYGLGAVRSPFSKSSGQTGIKTFRQYYARYCFIIIIFKPKLLILNYNLHKKGIPQENLFF